jgi:hypothetical protein
MKTDEENNNHLSYTLTIVKAIIGLAVCLLVNRNFHIISVFSTLCALFSLHNKTCTEIAANVMKTQIGWDFRAQTQLWGNTQYLVKS